MWQRQYARVVQARAGTDHCRVSSGSGCVARRWRINAVPDCGAPGTKDKTAPRQSRVYQSTRERKYSRGDMQSECVRSGASEAPVVERTRRLACLEKKARHKRCRLGQWRGRDGGTGPKTRVVGKEAGQCAAEMQYCTVLHSQSKGPQSAPRYWAMCFTLKLITAEIKVALG